MQPPSLGNILQGQHCTAHKLSILSREHALWAALKKASLWAASTVPPIAHKLCKQEHSFQKSSPVLIPLQQICLDCMIRML